MRTAANGYLARGESEFIQAALKRSGVFMFDVIFQVIQKLLVILLVILVLVYIV